MSPSELTNSVRSAGPQLYGCVEANEPATPSRVSSFYFLGPKVNPPFKPVTSTSPELDVSQTGRFRPATWSCMEKVLTGLSLEGQPTDSMRLTLVPPGEALPNQGPALFDGEKGQLLFEIGKFSHPVKLSGQTPSYFEAGQPQAAADGLALAKCRVLETGKLTDCRLLKHAPPHDSAVLAALSTWQMQPANFNGTPVEADCVLPFRFVAVHH